MERIVVTGFGIVSSIGIGVAETLQSLREGKSGIGRLKYLKTEHTELPCAEVPLSDAELKHLAAVSADEIITRTSLLGIIALQEALNSAQITHREGRRIAFINGTTVGGMEKSEQLYLDFVENNTQNAYISEHECGACTEKIAASTDHLFSYVTTLSTACSSAANAIALGANLIKTGVVEVAVVGGSECLTKFHLNGFNTLLILDKEPCRPFDDTRSGLNLGEGAAYLVLEKERETRSIKAILSGYGNACDAFHQTATSAEGVGIQLAMQKALAMSGLFPYDIDYINVHGTGTPNNDSSEGKSILKVFHDKLPAISSTKSMTGHTTSASGSIEAVISILALQQGLIPPNLGFQKAMSDVPLIPVSQVTNQQLRHVMSNSCGFGGNCTALIFSQE